MVLEGTLKVPCHSGLIYTLRVHPTSVWEWSTIYQAVDKCTSIHANALRWHLFQTPVMQASVENTNNTEIA